MHFSPRIIILVLVLSAAAAKGETITVLSAADGGPGTLRQAIFDASSGDTINFATGLHEIGLSSEELLINKNLTIEGPGVDNLAVQPLSGSSGFRVFHIAPASVTVTISGLMIKSGGAPNSEDGGGILNAGTLIVTNSTISTNRANNGGGIGNMGMLTVANTTISGNRANSGGGVANFAGGTLTITNSIVSDNLSSTQVTGNQSSNQVTGSQSIGGGIANLSGGMLTITNSTISGNQSSNQVSGGQSVGGGIANIGTLEIANSTISGNRANNGGGVANFAGGMLTIANSTISGNQSESASQSKGDGILASCGGGIFTDSGSSSTTALSTIVARNDGPSGGPDICGPLTSQGFNLVGNNVDAIITPARSSDLIGTPGAPIDPLIGPLQYNGGLTFTRALQSDSPAVNRGNPAAPVIDQRGYYRAGISDIGAFEFGGTVPVSLANISTRARVETGDNALIGGFIVTGLYPKKIIVRAIGPSLAVPSLTIPSVTRTTTGTASVAEVQRVLIPSAVGGTYRLIFYNPYLYGGAPSGFLPQRAALHASVTIGWNYSVGQIRDAILAANTWWAFSTNGSVLASNQPFSYFGTGSSREPVVTGTAGGYDIQFGTPISSHNTWVHGLNLIAIDDSNLQYGTGVLADPILELRNSSGELIASNDNWRSTQEMEIIHIGVPPTNDLESAIVVTLPANNSAYTAIVRGVNNGTGTAVVEVYDLNRTVDSKLGNISTRGLVQTGNNLLIAGTIVAGQISQKVIIRAIGPSLTLAGKLADPMLELRDTNGTIVASNDNWRTNQEAEIIATNLAPTNDLESAIVSTLPPSSYTAIVRGVNDTTGIAVVEAYTIQ